MTWLGPGHSRGPWSPRPGGVGWRPPGRCGRSSTACSGGRSASQTVRAGVPGAAHLGQRRGRRPRGGAGVAAGADESRRRGRHPRLPLRRGSEDQAGAARPGRLTVRAASAGDTRGTVSREAVGGAHTEGGDTLACREGTEPPGAQRPAPRLPESRMMNTEVRRSAARWRVPERRALRPEWWVLALAVVGVLLVEVWQSSRMAELCFDLARNRTEVQQAQARLEYLQAELDRHTTLANLAPQAGLLGLVPADDQQVVQLAARVPGGGGSAGRTGRPSDAGVGGKGLTRPRAGSHGPRPRSDELTSGSHRSDRIQGPAAPPHRARGGPAVCVNRRSTEGRGWPTGKCAGVGCWWLRPVCSSGWRSCGCASAGCRSRGTPTTPDAPRSTRNSACWCRPVRGEILDRHGRPLARDLMTVSVSAAPREMKDPAAVARGLAKLLHLDARQLAAAVPRAPALRLGRAPPAAGGGRAGGRPPLARRAPVGRDAARLHAGRRGLPRSSAARISTTPAWTDSSCSSTASCAAGPAGPRSSGSAATAPSACRGDCAARRPTATSPC